MIPHIHAIKGHTHTHAQIHILPGSAPELCLLVYNPHISILTNSIHLLYTLVVGGINQLSVYDLRYHMIEYIQSCTDYVLCI